MCSKGGQIFSKGGLCPPPRLKCTREEYGMGVDVPDIRHIIPWSPPLDIETYIQETERAVRDVQIAIAKLFYSKKDLSQSHIEESIKSYCNNLPSFYKYSLLNFEAKSNEVIVCKCYDTCSISCHCCTAAGL